MIGSIRPTQAWLEGGSDGPQALIVRDDGNLDNYTIPTADVNGLSPAQFTTIPVGLNDYWIDMPSPPSSAGSHVFTVTNNGAVVHNLVYEPEGSPTDPPERIFVPDLNPGDTLGTPPIELQPGTYIFFCPLEGHRELGMFVPVTVQ
jgi:hypothetical protein